MLNSGAAGPARGWWQFEQGGGVKGVLFHGTSRTRAILACEGATVVAEPAPVWRAIEGHDLLAFAMARLLLLLTDPYAVPTEASQAWACYATRLWRPDKPHPDKWGTSWAKAGEEYP